MKPTSYLLPKPADAGQASLANGVFCGDILRVYADAMGGWSDVIWFTGTIFPEYLDDLGMDVGFPMDTTQAVVVTPHATPHGIPGPETFPLTPEFLESNEEKLDRMAGRSILAMSTNKRQGWAAVVVDGGIDGDADHRDTQECEVIVGPAEDVLTPELIDHLRRWNQL